MSWLQTAKHRDYNSQREHSSKQEKQNTVLLDCSAQSAKYVSSQATTTCRAYGLAVEIGTVSNEYELLVGSYAPSMSWHMPGRAMACAMAFHGICQGVPWHMP